jgi:hypothetical protein
MAVIQRQMALILQPPERFKRGVTAVDNSHEMLRHLDSVERIETVPADITTLDLSPRQWPVVVLASQPFIAHEVDDQCLAQMAAAVGLTIDAILDKKAAWARLIRLSR